MSLLPVSGVARGATTRASAPPVRWNKQFGDSNDEVFNDVVRATDGGYVTVGYKRSANWEGRKGWIQKTDSAGKRLWQRFFGHPTSGIYFDEFNSVVRTSDGGYAVAGVTNLDGWLVKTDKAGRMQWEHTVGYFAESVAFNSLAQTSDGGYVLGGSRKSGAFAVKTDSAGSRGWQKVFKGPTNTSPYPYPSRFNSVIQTKDGGFAIAGEYARKDGQTISWFVKTRANGTKQWARTFGSDHASSVYTVIQTRDGGYALGGQLGHIGNWVMRTNSTGNKIWKKVFNEPPKALAAGVYDVLEANNGSFVCVGSDYTVGWIRKMSSSGAKQWHRTVNGRDEDGFNAFTPASGGGYVCAGYAQSGTVNNDRNGWLVKIGGK